METLSTQMPWITSVDTPFPMQLKVSGRRSASKSVRWLALKKMNKKIMFLGFFSKWYTYMYTRLLEPDKISHTQSMVAKSRPHKSGKLHTPTCTLKCRLKHKMAEFQSIQQFWLQLDIVS